MKLLKLMSFVDTQLLCVPRWRPAVIVPYPLAITCNHHRKPKVIHWVGSSLDVWYGFF